MYKTSVFIKHCLGCGSTMLLCQIPSIFTHLSKAYMLSGAAVCWLEGKTLHERVPHFQAAKVRRLALVWQKPDWTIPLSFLGNIMYILWSFREYSWVLTEACLPKMGLTWNISAFFRTLQMVMPTSLISSRHGFVDQRGSIGCSTLGSIYGDHHFWNKFVWLEMDKVVLFLLQVTKLDR